MRIPPQREDRAEKDEPDEHQAGNLFRRRDTGVEHVAQDNVAEHANGHHRQRQGHQSFDQPFES